MIDVGQLYAQHWRTVYVSVRRRLPGVSRETAEDLVEATFERALRAADRFDPSRGSAVAWLIVIARRLALDYGRQQQARRLVGLDRAERLAAPDRAIEQVGERELLVAALRRLRPHHRQIVVEHLLRGRSFEDIAADQAVCVQTLRGRKARALAALKRHLGELESGSGATTGVAA